jgi:hypothetical protein
MICQNCGANSSNDKICDYCNSRIKQIDTSEILIQEESKRAQMLELGGELSYVFEDKENKDQIYDRLVKKTREFLELGQNKKAEFFSQLLIKNHPNDEETIVLSATVMAEFATKASGSVQMAHIKKKYIADAKKILDKVEFYSLKDEADELYSRLDNMDGSKASSFTVQGDTSRNEGSSETVSGCLTVLGWITAGLICIAFFI